MTLHPSFVARTQPDKIAYRMAGSGAALTYGALDCRSNQGAQLFRALGLGPQDHIALLAENSLAFMEICWAAQRCGLYYTPISTHLTAGEVAYMVGDCGARVFIGTEALAAVAEEAATQLPATVVRYMIGSPAPGWQSWEDAIAAMPPTPVADEVAGYPMLYSSGTTGRPKGVKRPFLDEPIGQMMPIADLLCPGCAGSTRIPSTSRRRRSTMPRRGSSRAHPARSARPRSSWSGSTPRTSCA